MSGGAYAYNYKICLPVPPPGTDICETFSVDQTAVDPCNPPTSISIAKPDDQDYVITQVKLTFQHDDLVISPSYCEVKTTYVIPEFSDSSTAIDGPVETTVAKQFEIFYDSSLLPVDESPQTVTIQVEGSSRYDYGVDGLGDSLNFAANAETTFDVNYDSPCQDPNFFQINGPDTLETKLYKIYEGEITWTHEPFSVTTSPEITALCGDTETVVTFNTGVDQVTVTASSAPMTYERDTPNTFTFESDDPSLIDQTNIPYTVTVRLINDNSSFKTAAGVINFDTKCKDLDLFNEVAQDDAPATYYDTNNIWTRTDFTVTPS